MAAREQTGDRKLYRLVFAYNDFTNLLRESLNVIGHAGRICGNNIFRKHDARGNEFPAVTFAGALVSSLNLINQVFLRILPVVSLSCRRSVCAVGRLQPTTSSILRACENELEQEQGKDARRDNISCLTRAKKQRQ